MGRLDVLSVQSWQQPRHDPRVTDDRILGIPVSDTLLSTWARWFAPEQQPFLLPRSSSLAALGSPWTLDDSPPELRDTFWIYQLPEDVVARALTEQEFVALARPQRVELVRHQVWLGREVTPSVRSAVRHGDEAFARALRAQADGHRFVWWPSLLRGRERPVLTDHVEEGRFRSRHDEVSHAAGLTPVAPQRIENPATRRASASQTDLSMRCGAPPHLPP